MSAFEVYVGSNDYEYVELSSFEGGINVQPEAAAVNQCIDAQNHWVPLTKVERRPGAGGYVGASDSGVNGTTFTSSAFYVNGVAPGGPSVPINVGDIITPSTYTGNPLTNAVYVSLSIPWTTLPSNTNLVFEVQASTSRGWVGGLVGLRSFGFCVAGKLIIATGDSVIDVVFPTDAVIDPTTRGYFRLVITGLYNTSTKTFSSSGSAGTLTQSAFGDMTPNVRTNASTLSASYRAQYATGSRAVCASFIYATTKTTYFVIQYGDNLTTSIGNAFSSFFTLPIPIPTNTALPATFTVIPEFNTAFMASLNVVYECPYSANPFPAVVNTNPAVVGPTVLAAAGGGGTQGLYPSDQISQSATFPAANLIVYFKGVIWAAGIAGSPQVIQWSAPAASGLGALRSFDVWPTSSVAALSTAADNSPITAIANLADNLIVFKKNSIWQMVDGGNDPNTGLPLYNPRLIVSGVGALSHSSVKAIPQGLIFLAEDGFYLFDGTPNVKRLSDDIRTYIDRINPGRAPYSQGVVWRTKQYYLCAVSFDAENSSNNYVFCYDFQANAWWIWTGWDVQCWYQDDGVGLNENIWYFDRYGRAYLLGFGDTDNGTPVQSYLTTQRLEYGNDISETVREIRFRGQNNQAPVNFDVIVDDIKSASGTFIMPLVGEAQYAKNPLYGTAVYAPFRRRERKHPVWVVGRWFQVKIYNAIQLLGIDGGFKKTGRR